MFLIRRLSAQSEVAERNGVSVWLTVRLSVKLPDLTMPLPTVCVGAEDAESWIGYS
jgi:hypothetical protein